MLGHIERRMKITEPGWDLTSPYEAQVQFTFPGLSLLNLNHGVAAISSMSLSRRKSPGRVIRPLCSVLILCLRFAKPRKPGLGLSSKTGAGGLGGSRGLSCPAPQGGAKCPDLCWVSLSRLPLEELCLEKPEPCKGKFPGTILSSHQPFFFSFLIKLN